jgi:hypothetical protein
MSMKDSVAGTAKRLIGEIVGDGRLAEEGTRQAAAGTSASSADEPGSRAPAQSAALQSDQRGFSDLSQGNEARFAALLGRAALKTWADLPRDAQERLFAAAVEDGVIANDLAEFLHDHHPKTVHPPRPTRFA